MSTRSADTTCRPNASMACGSNATRVPFEVSSKKDDWPSQRSLGSFLSWAEDEPTAETQRTQRRQKTMLAFDFFMIFSASSASLRLVRLQKPLHQPPARL